MSRLAAAFVFAALMLGGAAAASDPTAEHKRVYAEVNDNLAGMEKHHFEMELPGAPVPADVTAWNDDGVVRKLSIVYPGDHGDTVEDYYYEGAEGAGELVFVYQRIDTAAIDGSNASSRENRYYFRDSHLFLWLDNDHRKVSPSSDEFARTEQDLLAASDAAMGGAMPPEPTGGPTPSGSANAEELTGVFTGLEEGDYTYLKLKVGGEERSFMILDTDDSIEALIADPGAYEGKKISITWQTTEQDIPEAGGKTEVDQLLSVSLPN